jgi:ABC-type transporter MlaC component
MAANGTQAFAPVLAALQTMQSNVDRAQKGQAHEFLEQFQKSVTFQYSGSLLDHPTNSITRTKHGTQPS